MSGLEVACEEADIVHYRCNNSSHKILSSLIHVEIDSLVILGADLPVVPHENESQRPGAQYDTSREPNTCPHSH